MKIFNLPDLGEGLPDAAIVAWHVKEGDEVKVDQLLVSVETAKAVVDIPSPYSGTIEKICANVGEVVNINQSLVIFKSEIVTAIKETTINAMPAVRSLAKKLNIDLSKVIPSGLNNTITIKDVEQFATNLEQKDDWCTLDHIAKNMAFTMQQANLEVVPATIFEDLILPNNKQLDLTVHLMLAIVCAAKIEPSVNAWFKKDYNNFKQKIFKEVNLGIAVDSKEGLFVPVINNVESKSADMLRAELNVLREQINTKGATTGLQHPTFILSNFGKFAGRYATPIIVPPTVAILAVGKIREIMVIAGSSSVIKKCAPLSLSFDHRAVTGGQAARFLQAILQFFAEL